MLALLQRVQYARVAIDANYVASIGQGLLILCGFQPQDTQASASKLWQKCLKYRVFNDENNKMNLSVIDIDGEVLLVPQFTLAAATAKGLRPGFSTAATPAFGQQLFNFLTQQAGSEAINVGFGQFGADMQIELCNDGPVTFLLEG